MDAPSGTEEKVMNRYLKIAFLVFCLTNAGKIFADVSYAQLSSLITQTPTSGAGSLLKLEQADILKNFEQSPEKDKLIVKQSGVYLAIAAGQVGATNKGATGYIDFWFTKNGVVIPNSTVRSTIDNPTSTGVLVSQSIMQLTAGDTLSVMYTASGPSLGFVFFKPDSVPGIPSFIFSITKLE